MHVCMYMFIRVEFVCMWAYYVVYMSMLVCVQCKCKWRCVVSVVYKVGGS